MALMYFYFDQCRGRIVPAVGGTLWVLPHLLALIIQCGKKKNAFKIKFECVPHCRMWQPHEYCKNPQMFWENIESGAWIKSEDWWKWKCGDESSSVHLGSLVMSVIELDLSWCCNSSPYCLKKNVLEVLIPFSFFDLTHSFHQRFIQLFNYSLSLFN